MALSQKHIRIAVGLYEECSVIFQQLGFNTSTAITMFFTYVARENGILFTETPGGRYGTTLPKSINIDETLYSDVKEILEGQGYTLSQAVNLYFETVSKTKGIPFPLQLKQ